MPNYPTMPTMIRDYIGAIQSALPEYDWGIEMSGEVTSDLGPNNLSIWGDTDGTGMSTVVSLRDEDDEPHPSAGEPIELAGIPEWTTDPTHLARIREAVLTVMSRYRATVGTD